MKAYGVGVGKFIPWSQLIRRAQGPTSIKEVHNHEFYPLASRAIRRLPATMKVLVITLSSCVPSPAVPVSSLRQRNFKTTFILVSTT